MSDSLLGSWSPTLVVQCNASNCALPASAQSQQAYSYSESSSVQSQAAHTNELYGDGVAHLTSRIQALHDNWPQSVQGQVHIPAAEATSHNAIAPPELNTIRHDRDASYNDFVYL